MAIILTKSSMPIIRWVAELLGLLMNGIYYLISSLGVPNVGLAIILFTIILLAAMTPLQVRQQRFSKLNNIMQPELQKIQNKYKGKKDQASQQKMMDETNAVYAKYGVSPTGSCIQMAIQLPVLFALYQVIYKIPGYITIIRDEIASIASNSEFTTMFAKFVTDTNAQTLTRNYSNGETKNIIDAIYGLTTSQWSSLLEKASGQSYESTLSGIHDYVHRATNFLGLNISDSPWEIMRTSWASGAYLLVIAALLFPILAWFTQWLNYKLMPQPKRAEGDDTASAMQNSMQSMNLVMPVMSAFFCLTLPVGVGIYWIMSAVVRSIQQVVVNRKLDKETPEQIMEEAQKKLEKKREKEGLAPQKITTAAHVSTRNYEARKRSAEDRQSKNKDDAKKRQAESTEYYKSKQARPGSIAAKANMVRDFDAKNQYDNKKYKK